MDLVVASEGLAECCEGSRREKSQRRSWPSAAAAAPLEEADNRRHSAGRHGRERSSQLSYRSTGGAASDISNALRRISSAAVVVVVVNKLTEMND